MPQVTQDVADLIRNANRQNPFEVKPEGNYKVRLVKVETGMSKGNNGSEKVPMWTWHFVFADNPNKKVRYWTRLTDDDLWKLAVLYDAFGKDPSVSTDELLGQEILAHVTVDVYAPAGGKPRKQNMIEDIPDQNLPEGPIEADSGSFNVFKSSAPAAAPPVPSAPPAVDTSPDF